MTTKIHELEKNGDRHKKLMSVVDLLSECLDLNKVAPDVAVSAMLNVIAGIAVHTDADIEVFSEAMLKIYNQTKEDS